MASKRVWKPLSVGGLRLYKVEQNFPGRRDWNRTFIVAATSPSHARALIEKVYEDATFQEGLSPLYYGRAINIYMPADWWENGVPSFPFDLKQAKKEGKQEGALAALEALKSAGLLNIVLNRPGAKERFFVSLKEAGVPCKLDEEAEKAG
jgi:hypothetical protein